ncbi:hypothetical protein BGLA2_140017 [Burkholderia gladioli]|nr:hypothetical protein BGLA2_140017 [Burkholderia gladioli]
MAPWPASTEGGKDSRSSGVEFVRVSVIGVEYTELVGELCLLYDREAKNLKAREQARPC